MTMFEDYEDIFCAPSEAEEIIDKALGDLKALFVDNVKNTIEEAKSATEQLEVLTQQLRKTQWRLKEAEQKLAATEKKFEESELRDMPRKYINRFVEEVSGGYKPGDTVWVIEREVERISCKTCDGLKEVTALINGVESRITCPTCKGYGADSKYTDVIEHREVREVRVKLCFDKYRANYWSTDSVFLAGQDWSTSPEKIYPTEDAARAALESGADNG